MAVGLDLPGAAQSERDDYRRDPCPSNAQLIRAAMGDHVALLRELPRLISRDDE